MKRLAVGLALLAGSSAHADEVARWRAPIDEASQRFGVPSHWIERVMRAESGGQTMLGGHPIRSAKGAIGLMQLMPATWMAMRDRLGLGSNPDDPHDNILAGSFFLRLLYDRFGYPGLFAAYNAGPARYAGFLAGKRALPRESVGYLAAVGRLKTGSVESSPKRLFVIGDPASADDAASLIAQPKDALFAVRRSVR